MSENLSFGSNNSNFSFTRALVFSLGKPDSNWFKATVGDSLVMVFYPEDSSITASMIQPGDTVYVAGVQNMEVRGSCDKKANCAPFALQIDAFKNAVRYRQRNNQAEIKAAVDQVTIGNKPKESLPNSCMPKTVTLPKTTARFQYVQELADDSSYKATDQRRYGKALGELVDYCMRHGISPFIQ